MFFTKVHPKHNRVILRGPFAQAFNDPFFPNPFVNVRPTAHQRHLPIDLLEKEEEFVVRAVVPGFGAEEIDISVKEDVLTLSAEVKEENETKEENYHIREIHVNSFNRQVRLPGNVDTDNATADYKNGILTIHLPKLQVAAARKIAVK